MSNTSVHDHAPTHDHARTSAPRLAWRPLQRSTRVAIIGALLAAFFYQLFLLNPAYRGPWWLWGAMLLAEGLTALHALGTWWTILAHDDHPEPAEVALWRDRLRARALASDASGGEVAGVEVPAIDVYVTVCGEPLSVVAGTLRAARDMRLPHRTWVLDDGRSDEVRRLCQTERVEYLRRTGRDDAKAGNVNAALAHTSGEYVAIFDADHIPEPDFLLQVLPHFRDQAVAFVQSPQHFSNRRNLVSTGSAEAQRIFYELVCPGKNRFNAAFCVGTNVMFRRKALAGIGGFVVGTNSEDVWTSLELHRRGWKSIYVPDVVANGLAPEDVGSYFRQQLRWACGGFEVLLRGRLFRRRSGLSVDQRLQYMFTGTHYLLSVAMLIFMMLPATYLLFQLSPIKANGWTWASHYLPFYGMVLLVTWLQSGGFRLAAIVSSIGAAPVHARALSATLRRRPARWAVTNASRGGRSLWIVMPHLALLVLNVTAIAVGVIVMADPAPTWLCVGWASMHVLILGRVIIESLRGHRVHDVAERGAPYAAVECAPAESGAEPAPATVGTPA